MTPEDSVVAGQAKVGLPDGLGALAEAVEQRTGQGRHGVLAKSQFPSHCNLKTMATKAISG